MWPKLLRRRLSGLRKCPTSVIGGLARCLCVRHPDDLRQALETMTKSYFVILAVLLFLVLPVVFAAPVPQRQERSRLKFA